MPETTLILLPVDDDFL